MIEDIADILITKGVVNGDGSEPIKDTGQIDDGPFGTVASEYSNKFELFSFWLLKQFFMMDATTNIKDNFFNLMITHVVNPLFFFLPDNCSQHIVGSI